MRLEGNENNLVSFFALCIDMVRVIFSRCFLFLLKL